MPLVSEVADLIKKLGDVVKSTREIVEAVNDGRKFLKLRYPDAQPDLINLLNQMQQAIEGLARVTRVVSSFRFVFDGTTTNRPTADRELSRFNDYVIAQREDVATLKGQIRQLKADCDRVRVLRDKLDAHTKSRSWGSMFELFGTKAKRRSLELHGSLSNFYADDQRMIELLTETLKLAEGALQEVVESLGPPGIADPYRVPAAAAILMTYSRLFEDPQNELNRLADELSAARSALQS
jgi:hypothetical protein